jgi:hypothetical protein
MQSNHKCRAGKEVRQWEDKIIFDKNEFSLKVENSPVFMKPIDKSEAVEINIKQKKENMVVLSGSANGWAEIYQDFYCS